MDHDLGTHSSSSPYHQHSREPSHLDSTQSAAAALSLQDYLATVMSPGTVSAALPPAPASGYDAFASPPAEQNAQPVNFADILAEFTLAQNAFSPDASGNRGGGDSSAESTSPNLAPTNGNRPDKTAGAEEEEQPAPAAQAKSAQEILLEQLKALYPAAPAPTPAAPSHHVQKTPQQQQQQHSSQVEAQPSPHSQPGSTYAPSPSSSSSHGVQLGAEMQAQLQQWLAQSMPTNNSNMTSQTPTPTGPPAAASAHMHHHHHQSGSAGFHAPAHLQHQHSHSHHSASPSGYSLPQSPGVATFAHTHSSAPSSLHASPMPFYAGTPHEQQQQQQQHYPGSSPATPLGHGHPAASSSFHPYPPPVANMPGAAVAAAALAALSPLLAGTQPTSPGGGSSLQAQLNALQMLVTANAQAQAQAQMQATAHAQNQQANAGSGMHGQQQPILEHQQATPLQQPSNPQTPFDIRTSAPGTASSSYRETDVSWRSLWTRDSDPRR